MTDASASALDVVGWIGGLSWIQVGCLLIVITISFGLIQLLLNSFWGRYGGWPSIHIWVSTNDDNTPDKVRATTEDTLLPWMYGPLYTSSPQFKYRKFFVLLTFPISLMLSGCVILYHITAFMTNIVWILLLFTFANYKLLVASVIAVKTLQFAYFQDILTSACSEFYGDSDLFHSVSIALPK